MIERVNEELHRRSQVIRIFPNADSCQRLMRAVAVEIHEKWMQQCRYLDMSIPLIIKPTQNKSLNLQ